MWWESLDTTECFFLFWSSKYCSQAPWVGSLGNPTLPRHFGKQFAIRDWGIGGERGSYPLQLIWSLPCLSTYGVFLCLLAVTFKWSLWFLYHAELTYRPPVLVSPTYSQSSCPLSPISQMLLKSVPTGSCPGHCACLPSCSVSSLHIFFNPLSKLQLEWSFKNAHVVIKSLLWLKITVDSVLLGRSSNFLTYVDFHVLAQTPSAPISRPCLSVTYYSTLVKK